MQKIITDSEILHAGIIDAINGFVREVLIPRGLIPEEAWNGEGSEELDKLKHEVAERVSESWKVSWKQ